MNKLLFLLVTAGFLATQCHQGSSEPAIKVRQDLFNTSMRDSVTCYRIPSIVTAPNGDRWWPLMNVVSRVLICIPTKILT